jgi:hypothetical protein
MSIEVHGPPDLSEMASPPANNLHTRTTNFQRVTIMGLNTKSPGVRRILEEAKEIQADPSVDFVAGPSEVNNPPSPH